MSRPSVCFQIAQEDDHKIFLSKWIHIIFAKNISNRSRMGAVVSALLPELGIVGSNPSHGGHPAVDYDTQPTSSVRKIKGSLGLCHVTLFEHRTVEIM